MFFLHGHKIRIQTKKLLGNVQSRTAEGVTLSGVLLGEQRLKAEWSLENLRKWVPKVQCTAAVQNLSGKRTESEKEETF